MQNNKVDKSGKILVIDDNEDILHAAKLLLKRYFEIVVVESNPENIPFIVSNHDFDIIMLDMNFAHNVSEGTEGFFWLQRILQINPSAVVIFITAYADVELAVKAMKEGATDFITKPWENEKLLATLLAALKKNNNQKEQVASDLVEKQVRLGKYLQTQAIIGKSNGMLKIFNLIEKIADTDANVLILGENGTGKEIIARAIHHNSPRSSNNFVSVDLGAISQNLFESELFGHVKGSFTDAKEDKPGRFEIASKGSIFLDEIGNLPLPLQSKLLSIIQTKNVTRVGSNKSKDIDFRLICATNMPLYEMVKNNTFRQDLLFRINTIEVHIPPLRERKEDIPLLIEHYLQIFNKKYKRNIKAVSKALLHKMQSYHWPGNIRELQHTMERAVIMSDGDGILNEEEISFQENLKEEDSLENFQLDDIEKAYIQKALKKYNGNISHASKELGLTRAALYRRIEKYGI